MKSSTKDRDTKPAPAPPADEPEKSGPELLSPMGWAKRLGKVKRLKLPLGQEFVSDYRHGMAASIHGWGAYEYHEAKPVELSQADYEAALEVAEKPPPYAPHKPALTKYAAPEYQKAAR